MEAVRGPGADAVATRSHELIEVLVTARAFNKVGLAPARDALARGPLHRHGFRAGNRRHHTKRSEEQGKRQGFHGPLIT